VLDYLKLSYTCEVARYMVKVMTVDITVVLGQEHVVFPPFDPFQYGKADPQPHSLDGIPSIADSIPMSPRIYLNRA